MLFFPFPSVCVYKTIIMRLWVLHTYVMSWELWSVNERRMTHAIRLDCLTLLHRLIFLIRLPHTLDFLVASLWVDLNTDLNIICAAFIFNPAYTHHSTVLFLSELQVICLIWYAVNRQRPRCRADQILCTHLRQCPAETLKSSGPDHTAFPFLAKWIKNDTIYLNRLNLTPETDGLDYI